MTHQPLEWPLLAFMEPVSSVPAGDAVTDVSTEYPHLRGRGPELSEYATLFGVRRLLEQQWGGAVPPPGEEWLGIGHYRRYAVTRPVGRIQQIYGVLSADEFRALDDDVFLPAPGTLVLPAVVGLANSVLAQYGAVHVLRDLLHFLSIAIDLGVIEDTAVTQFLTKRAMIAAPSVGVYPAHWYVTVLAQLERVVEVFESTVAVAHEGYQRRAVGFCCERLHGMLLALLLAEHDPTRVSAHPALLVSEDGTYTPNA